MSKPLAISLVRWRCTHCSQHGEVVNALSDPVNRCWDRIVVAHSEASPACADEWREGGLAVAQENGRLAEVAS